jgi:membrane protease YdiL (CAAX protease family)
VDYKEHFIRLKRTINAITHGNYQVSAEIEEYLDQEKHPEEVVDFAENLNLMTLKLEAREIALKNTISELESTNADLRESIEKREFISGFFASILVLTVVYTVSFAMMISYPSINSLIPRLTEIAVLILGIITIRKSKLPLRTFGLTLNGWKKSLNETFLFTAFIAVLMILYRIFLNQSNGIALNQLFPYQQLDAGVLMYGPVSFVQELLARGIIQTAMIIHFVHPRKVLISIFLVACIFGGAHLNYSLTLAIASFLLSFGWGYLFYRTPTIIGVVISHFILGNLAYYLGFWDFLIQHPM